MGLRKWIRFRLGRFGKRDLWVFWRRAGLAAAYGIGFLGGVCFWGDPGAGLPSSRADDIVVLQPEMGDNEGTDDGSSSKGKDATFHYDTGENQGWVSPGLVLNSPCNVGLLPLFIQFSTDGMPDQDFSRAEVHLYTDVRFNGVGWPWQPGTWHLALRRVLEEWDEMSLTKDNQPAWDDEILDQRPFATTGGGSWGNPYIEYQDWMRFDVTELYKKWVRGKLPNYGLVLTLEEEHCANGDVILITTSDEENWPEYRPKLVVTRCIQPPQGLVSWWRGENYGPTAEDTIRSFHGELKNGAGRAAGVYGSAWDLDGIDDYIEVDYPTIGDFQDKPFTVEFWINPGSTGSNIYIMGKSHPDNGEGWDMRLNDQKLRLEGTDGWDPAYNWESTGTVPAYQWSHIAISATEDTISIYINGALDGTTTRGTISTASNPFRIGWTTNFGGTPFRGQLDEISIYDRALTADEIQAIYYLAGGGKCQSCFDPYPHLVGWWRANYDGKDSVRNNHARLYNGANFSTGKISGAFNSDGEDDYFLIPDSQFLHADPITIETWVKMDQEETTDGIIVAKHASEAGGHMTYGLWLRDGRWQGRAMVDGILYDVDSGVSAQADTWTHLSLSFDNEFLKIYVNGIEKGAVQAQGSLSYGSEPIVMGNYDRNPSSSNGFKGLIDELAVYSKALSSQEVALLYHAGTLGKCNSEEVFFELMVSGPGVVTYGQMECQDNCSASFPRGSQIELTATPLPGSVFLGWGQDCPCGNQPSCIKILDENNLCSATFQTEEDICPFSILPTSKNVKYRGGTVRVKVQALEEDCSTLSMAWSGSWLDAELKKMRNNKGLVKVKVAPNTSSLPRQGEMNIGGQKLTIFQDGAPCRILGIDPVRASFGSSSEAGQFLVSAPEGCSWNAESLSTDWLNVLSGASGTGDGLVGYEVAENPTGRPRKGKILVTTEAGSSKSHKVKQGTSF
ncbi:MAG: LamG-like jellyroll fold domain-containing protein [bacterium]